MKHGFTVYEIDLSKVCACEREDELYDEHNHTMYVGTKREAEHYAATARQLVRKYLTQYAAWQRANDGELDEDEADEWMEDEPPTPSLVDRYLDVDPCLLTQESAIRVYRVQLQDTTPRQLALRLLDSRTNGWWQHSSTLVSTWHILRRIP